jgi:hypothetical protein
MKIRAVHFDPCSQPANIATQSYTALSDLLKAENSGGYQITFVLITVPCALGFLFLDFDQLYL